MIPTLDSLPDDPATLKAMILAQHEEVTRMSASVRAYESLVEALKARILRLRKQKFGSSSERITREIAQLELALEDLQVAHAREYGGQAEGDPAPTPESESTDKPQGRRRGRPRVDPQTPRTRETLDPGEECPDCGGPLRLLGEDVSELLELVTAQLKVIEIARLKKSCRCCEKVVQPEAPSRPIPRSMAGPGLLAHILVSKFDDHLPLYRQTEILARQGAEIPRSTLVDWCGQSMAVVAPLVARIKDHVLAGDRLHGDDTPIKVLDPRRPKAAASAKAVKEGRIWTYVRDDRAWGCTDPPAVAYWFSPDRKGVHPQEHLKDFRGILQADAYAGFRKLYEPDAEGKVRVREAACWAHLRRDFHDVWKATGSKLAEEALNRIGALYDLERAISGQAPEMRYRQRQAHSRPRVEAFRTWCEAQLARISGKSGLAKAMRYALNRWPAFTLFLEDGRVAIDNNVAERAMRPIAIGRKNYLFAGSDAGGETLADAMTLIEAAKLSGHDPQAYLANVLARINDHPINRIDDLLPWNWTNPALAKAA
ncbi:IS66 family transposase [Fodinicurvata sediminis]|uniref:IS66 family transposase n=1 Tax=Fodinicurvata sediminis TaxID=1121832 RepID=UPI0003B60F84|nr:IS66 family transposase [Fodinicurvata sediminis]